MTSPSDESGAQDPHAPDEMFALLGNDTRIGILQALWDQFESGLGDNSLSYSALFDAIAISDSGNFSYHLEKLTGPFVRRTDTGYELKQTGINHVRAIVSGTVTQDPSFGPTPVGVACPICDAPVEVSYDDELLLAICSRCAGARAWDGEHGFLFAGLIPPVLLSHRSIESGFRAAVTFVIYQIVSLHDGVCPHCSGRPENHLEACRDHEPGSIGLCPNCNRRHQSEAWMQCRTCKWRVFPPATFAVLADPRLTTFYQNHGIDHRFATWEGLVRTFEFEEELRSVNPLEVQITVPAGDDELQLVVDEDLTVLNSGEQRR